jgi:hypothetical protein
MVLRAAIAMCINCRGLPLGREGWHVLLFRWLEIWSPSPTSSNPMISEGSTLQETGLAVAASKFSLKLVDYHGTTNQGV